jgi:hypothetical protein
MDKKTFINELTINLKHLTNEIKAEEIAKYNELDTNKLDPIEEANKIYKNHGLNITVTKKTSFINSMTILVDILKSNDKKKISNVLLFFLYLIFILIIIKIPFIYVRDITSSIFNNFLSNELAYSIWYLLFEILYAITTIITLINLIKNKANQIEKITN